jgi:nicotinamidase-related amidase
MLSAISVAEKGKMAIITAPNAVELLAVVVLDRHAHKDLRDNCVLTIRSMCEAGEGLTAMGMRLLSESDIFNEILSRMEASKIIATMLETDRQREALEALVLLVKTGLGRKAAWNILDIIPKLHKISQTASDQRVRGLTSRCLEALCLDNHMAQAELDKLPVLATGSNDVFGTGKVTLLGPETAILLVCYQNDFCQKAGALQGHVNDSMEESQMMSNTVDLKEKARRKGAAFHYVNFHSSPELASTDSGNGFLKMVVAENAFVKDTWGTQVTHELQPEPEDTVYNMHSLSPFEDTDLDQKLKELSVQNVVVCGFMTDGAVEKTLRDAYERGYTTYFLTDCAAASSSMQENYIETVLPAFCEALTRNQLLAFMPSALGQ